MNYIKFDERVYILPCVYIEGMNWIIPVENEKTPFGSLLISALWFNKDVLLIKEENGKTYSSLSKVKRCLIVGSLFSSILEKFRSFSKKDMASCYVISPSCWNEYKLHEKLYKIEKGKYDESHLDIYF